MARISEIMKNAASGVAKTTAASTQKSSATSTPDASRNSAKKGDTALLGNGDQATMNALTQKWNEATAAGNTALADSIHQQAEAIRAGYGYSGGADGSGLIITGKGSSNEKTSGGREPESLENYLNDMYDQQARQAEAQLKAAYDENIGALDEAARVIPGQYQTARNRAAGASAVAGANFNEYAAAQGLGNGSAGQAQLARGNALQSDLNAMNKAEADALAQIEAERQQITKQYQTAITQARAANKAALAEALYSEMVRLQEEYQQFEQQQRQWQYQLETDDYNRRLNEAKLAAQYGDTSGLAALGILSPAPTSSAGGYRAAGGSGGGDTGGSMANTPAAQRAVSGVVPLTLAAARLASGDGYQAAESTMSDAQKEAQIDRLFSLASAGQISIDAAMEMINKIQAQ